MAKSLLLAYFFWATSGLFGGHHFYLGRDRHAVIHLFTLGGFFLGWIYDGVNLRNYVNWANFDAKYKEEYLSKIKNGESSSSAFRHIASSVMIQNFASFVLWTIHPDAISESWLLFLKPIITAVSIAYGVYHIGNIGDKEGSFLDALKGSIISVPYYWYYPDGSTIWCMLSSKHFFGKSQRQRPRPESSKSLLKRLIYISAMSLLVGGIFTGFVFNNCTVETEEDNEIECTEFVKNLMNSPFWKDLGDALGIIWSQIKHNGFKNFYYEMMRAFDLSGTDTAAGVLGVPTDASEETIKNVYKTLAKKYHPDKVKDPLEREIAAQKFVEIQKAYELLSNTKIRRRRKNKQWRQEDKESDTIIGKDEL